MPLRSFLTAVSGRAGFAVLANCVALWAKAYVNIRICSPSPQERAGCRSEHYAGPLVPTVRSAVWKAFVLCSLALLAGITLGTAAADITLGAAGGHDARDRRSGHDPGTASVLCARNRRSGPYPGTASGHYTRSRRSGHYPGTARSRMDLGPATTNMKGGPATTTYR